jgi:anti-sigma factor RsiW
MTEHVLEHLSAYLDGELGAAEQERFRAHLAHCAACARRLAELASVDRSLRELPSGAPERYFDELPARLRGRLSAAAPPRQRLKTLPVWTLAAAATLLVGVLAPLTLLDKPAQAPAAKVAAEVDTLARSQTASAAPAATIPAAAMPLASPAPAEREESKRTDSKARRVEQPKREALAAQLDESVARPPAAPPAQAGGVIGGFAPPPRAAEPQSRQSGPRANQQIEPDRQQQSRPAPAAAPAAVADSAVRSRDLEKKDADAAPATEEQTLAQDAANQMLGRAAAKAVRAPAASYRELQARTAPRSAEEARALRDSWRALAAEARDTAQADEARVQVIRLGLEAWRIGRQTEDRRQAEADAAGYLARDDARQRDRVRGLLAGKER